MWNNNRLLKLTINIITFYHILTINFSPLRYETDEIIPLKTARRLTSADVDTFCSHSLDGDILVPFTS